MRQQWEEEMERLNTKYNLDCFSDSELDSESDEDEQYQYKHGYEMLIWRTLENQDNRKARNSFAVTSFLKSTLPMVKLKF